MMQMSLPAYIRKRKENIMDKPNASATIRNLKSAFAGESMAHIKYRYSAKLCCAAGDEASARVF
jgi:hypothetical protein